MTATRLVVRRTMTSLATALAAVLAVFAVFLSVQSNPTETAAQARTTLAAAVTAASGMAVLPAPDLPCEWFGVDGAPTNGKVSPQLLLSGTVSMAADALRDLDGVADRLAAQGWKVGRPGGGLDAQDSEGRRVTTQAGLGGLGLIAQGPCVWPDGERKPSP